MMNTMKCTIENTSAYIILVFVIAALCVGLRDNRSVDYILDIHECLSDNQTDASVIRNSRLILPHAEDAAAEQSIYDTDLGVISFSAFGYHENRVIKNYIIFAYISGILLLLCLISGIAINVYGRCIVKLWRVVRYIHNIDGEKWNLRIFAQ